LVFVKRITVEKSVNYFSAAVNNDTPAKALRGVEVTVTQACSKR
jgi:hypothetical protein